MRKVTISKFLEVVALVPGIIFTFGVGFLSILIGRLIPHVNYLIISIALGILISNTIKTPSFVEQGINTTYNIWLETGIVVLGAGVILSDILDVGRVLLWMVIGFLAFSLFYTEFLSSCFKLDKKLGSILASGASVCGVSAIIATSGGIKAQEKHVVYAIATILVFDVITVFLYPTMGEIFSIPPPIFGVWAGISMFSTGTAVAAGFAYSELAGQMATIVKMSRNAFIGIWALLYTLYYVEKGTVDTNTENKAKYLWDKFPKFIVGFLITMYISNVGMLSETQVGYMKNAYRWLFLLAFVGLGYNVNFAEMKKTGLRPILVVSISFVTVSLASLGLAYLFLG